jgi:hypothetical protein
VKPAWFRSAASRCRTLTWFVAGGAAAWAKDVATDPNRVLT